MDTERIQPAPGEHSLHSLTSLLGDLKDETTTLVQQEIALAKAEVTEKISRASKHVASIAIGAALAFAAALLLLNALRNLLMVGLVAAGLSPAVAIWLSPLIIAVIVGAIAVPMILNGKKALTTEGMAPEKTVESLRTDKQFIKGKLAHI